MMKIFACIAVFPVLASLLSAADSVPVYLEPTKDGTIYFREDLAKLNQRKPQPYPPGQDVTEWMTLQYPGTYVGYVKPAAVSEDMAVAEGTAILLRPDASSNALAVVDGSFQPQVIELGPNWATVYYEGDATAYFPWPSKQSTPPVAPVAETVTVTSAPAEGGEIVAVAESEEVVVPVAASASGPTPANTAAATMVAPAPATKVAPAAPAAAAPAPAPAPVIAKSSPPELEPMAATPRPSAVYSPPPSPLTSKQVTRTWQGKLVKNKGLDKLFGKDYPYYLENAAGDRIAYVDLSDALLFQPVENFWDANVIIDGTVEEIVDPTPVLIKVRVIRPQF